MVHRLIGVKIEAFGELEVDDVDTDWDGLEHLVDLFKLDVDKQIRELDLGKLMRQVTTEQMNKYFQSPEFLEQARCLADAMIQGKVNESLEHEAGKINLAKLKVPATPKAPVVQKKSRKRQ